MNTLAHYRNLLEAIDTNTAWMKNVKAQGGKLSVVTKPNVTIMSGNNPLIITGIDIPLDPAWNGTVGVYFNNPVVNWIVNNPVDEPRYNDIYELLYDRDITDESWVKIDQLIAKSLGVHESVLMNNLMDIESLNGDGVGIRVYINPELVKNAIDQIFMFNKELTKYAIVNDIDIIKQIPNPDLELFSDPEIKHAIIVGMLKNLKASNVIETKSMLSYLINHNVNWPELAAIKRSIDAQLT